MIHRCCTCYAAVDARPRHNESADCARDCLPLMTRRPAWITDGAALSRTMPRPQGLRAVRFGSRTSVPAPAVEDFAVKDPASVALRTLVPHRSTHALPSVAATEWRIPGCGTDAGLAIAAACSASHGVIIPSTAGRLSVS